ncbi:uncharacterized protein LOC133925021 isoform X2 [Phragmites australis]|uniref:uncharacterized protein LOC133925021 isoform X2 n=1 Tax=Phragmites australis TaxID=29695 RepID=UPI002D799017|nr:uncharacterized protein LOC133925021 isoform X2 [Phragmites australis]
MCSADEVEDPDGKILFGQRSSEPICKKKLMLGEQARSPWNMGCMHPDNGCVVPQKLASWVYAAADVYLKRNWVIHHSPKYIQLSSEAFRSQLVGSNPMGFELCDILIRRFTQLDADMRANSWKCRWRHFFESDFYMLVPACINQVWCCFSFDMWNKVIYVLDPCGPNPHTALKRHAAQRILDALCKCISAFFDNWQPDPNAWQVHFPVLNIESCNVVHCGVCMLHCARNFKGDALAMPLKLGQIPSLRNALLCEALTISGNNVAIPLPLKTIIANSVY